LIGFGIGISCCLVYRWFKHAFFTIEVEKLNVQTNHQAYVQSSNCNDSQLLVHNRNNQNNQFLRKSKIKSYKRHSNNIDNTSSSCSNFRSSSFINYYHNNIKNRFSSRTNSKSQFNKNSDSSQFLTSTFYNDFDDPLNDVYQNLIKFLNKQFFKTFRMRRPKNKRYKDYSNNSYNVFKCKTQTNLNKPLNNNQTTKQNDSSSSTLFTTNKNFLDPTKLTKVNKIKSKVNSYSFCEDSSLSANNFNDDGYFNIQTYQKTYSDNLNDYFAIENYRLNFDDDSLELFRSTSQQSNNINEFNDLTGNTFFIYFLKEKVFMFLFI